jgi:type IV pilus assembly protein PilO
MSTKTFIASFERISFRNKILIGIGLIAVVVMLFYFIIYQTQVAKTAKLQNDLKDLAQRQRLLIAQSKEIEKISQTISTLDKRIGAISTYLPTKEDVPELLKQISEISNRSAVSLLLFRPGIEVKRTYVAEIPIEIQVRGSYIETAQFFYSLSRQLALHDNHFEVSSIVKKRPRIVNITDFTMGKVVPEERGVFLGESKSTRDVIMQNVFIISTALTVKTFRMLTPEERKEMKAKEEEEQKSKGKKKSKKKH